MRSPLSTLTAMPFRQWARRKYKEPKERSHCSSSVAPAPSGDDRLPAYHASTGSHEHEKLEMNFAQPPTGSRITGQPWEDNSTAAEREIQRLRCELKSLESVRKAEIQRVIQHKTAQEAVLRWKLYSTGSYIHSLSNPALRHCSHVSGIVDDLEATIQRLQRENSDLEKEVETMRTQNKAIIQLVNLSSAQRTKADGQEFPLSNSRHRLLLSPIPRHQHPSKSRRHTWSGCSHSGIRSTAVQELGIRSAPHPTFVSSQCLPLQRVMRPSNALQEGNRVGPRNFALASYLTAPHSSAKPVLTGIAADQSAHSRRIAKNHRRRFPRMCQMQPLLLTLESGVSITQPLRPFASRASSFQRCAISTNPDTNLPYMSKAEYEMYVSTQHASFHMIGRHIAYHAIRNQLVTPGFRRSQRSLQSGEYSWRPTVPALLAGPKSDSHRHQNEAAGGRPPPSGPSSKSQVIADFSGLSITKQNQVQDHGNHNGSRKIVNQVTLHHLPSLIRTTEVPHSQTCRGPEYRESQNTEVSRLDPYDKSKMQTSRPRRGFCRRSFFGQPQTRRNDLNTLPLLEKMISRISLGCTVLKRSIRDNLQGLTERFKAKRSAMAVGSKSTTHVTQFSL